MPAQRLYYDLHLHSCLSPCGDEDMTPWNIVRMAKLAGTDIVALTDHNTCKNCPPFLRAARECGLLALPGMELCTAEECHVLCFFPTMEAAASFDSLVNATLPPLKNRPEIFGRQLLTDDNDEVTAESEDFLAGASTLGIDKLPELTRRFGGVAVPAHIDRPSYSVTAALGTVPEGFPSYELTRSAGEAAWRARYAALTGHPLLHDSDAHALGMIPDAAFWVELEERTPKALLKALTHPRPGQWGGEKAE